MTFQDYKDATKALRSWFVSQEIHPADSLMIVEMFIAAMIVQNGEDEKDIRQKYELVNNGIHGFEMALRRSSL